MGQQEIPTIPHRIPEEPLVAPGTFMCEITAKGPKGPETGPVRDFFRNYTTFYTVVKTHCAKCPDCPPDEMLRAWRRLRERRNGGATSNGLVDMALKTERAVLREGVHPPLDPALTNWFIAASGDAGKMAVHEARFPDGEALAEAFRLSWAAWRSVELNDRMGGPNWTASRTTWINRSVRESLTRRGTEVAWAYVAMAEAFDRGARTYPGQDWMAMGAVAEVMCG